MKRILIIAVLTVATASVALGQKMSQDAEKEALVAMEKQAWEAWKMHDGKFFEGFLADEALNVTSAGVEEKAQIVKSIAGSDCEVRSYSLDEFKMVKLDENTRLLNYKAQQDATCSGNVLAPTVRATAVYVKRGGKWLNALYQETPVQ